MLCVLFTYTMPYSGKMVYDDGMKGLDSVQSTLVAFAQINLMNMYEVTTLSVLNIHSVSKN